MIERHPLVSLLKNYVVGVLIYTSVFFLRMSGKLMTDPKEIDNTLRAMWNEGIWVRKVDGSSFETH